MKTRQEIKAEAKVNFHRQYGTAVMLMLISLLVAFASSMLDALVDSFLGMGLVYWLVYLAGMVVIIVMSVNMHGGYIKIARQEKADIAELFTGFKVNFLRKLGGMCWMSLWIGLWSLLLIVPGIIKSFAYYFTPYILADQPTVTARQALKLSSRITKGHKYDIFVFLLSWLGWGILSVLTCGILWVLYVGPYFSTASAGLYITLRDKALADGRITRQELGMA